MKLFIAFILLIIIPVISLFMFSNHEVVEGSKKEIGKSCMDSLKTTDKSVMELSNTLYKDCVHLSLTDAVENLNQCSSKMKNITSDQRLILSQAQKVISQMLYSDDDYYSIYLYLDDYDYTITSDADLIGDGDFKDNSWLKSYISYKRDRIPVSFATTSRLRSSYGNGSTNQTYLATVHLPPDALHNAA